MRQRLLRDIFPVALALLLLITSAQSVPAGAQQPTVRAETVYATNTGKKYHRAGCQHLKKSSIPMTLGEAKSKGLGPCAQCRPPE